MQGKPMHLIAECFENNKMPFRSESASLMSSADRLYCKMLRGFGAAHVKYHSVKRPTRPIIAMGENLDGYQYSSSQI